MANETQIKAWNETNPPRWFRLGEVMTRPLMPFGEAAMQALRPRPGEKALDVGCGTGETTRALAAACGDALGIDVSAPFLDVARASGGARYLLADAQTHRFGEQFDMVFSRFGVMFFDDPLKAFSNLGSALRGRLAAVVWGPLAENEWASMPLEVLRGLMPVTDVAPGPGPFGLSDAGALAKLLQDAGFSDVRVDRLERTYDAGPAQLAEAGPAAAQLRAANPPEELRARFIDGMSKALNGRPPRAVVLLATAVRR